MIQSNLWNDIYDGSRHHYVSKSMTTDVTKQQHNLEQKQQDGQYHLIIIQPLLISILRGMVYVLRMVVVVLVDMQIY